MHIGKLFLSQYTVRNTSATSTGCTSSSMNEKFHFCWKIEMNHIFKKGDINTTCSQVSHKQKVHVLFSKFDQFLFTTALIHSTVNKRRLKSCFGAQLKQVFNMILCSAENDCLFTSLHSLSKNVHQYCFFLYSPTYKEMDL